MKKLVTLIPAFILAISTIQAQNIQENITVRIHGSNREDTIEIPHSLTTGIDSLLNDYRTKSSLSGPTNCQQKDENPYFPDSVYIQRLAQMPVVMEMPYNDIVRKFIDLYATKYRKKISYMLGASNFYMPLFEEALDVYGLPQELKYLPVIESALNPKAVSPVGATGLWQFMVSTSQTYNLEINSLVDERQDPIKSTWVAVHYLKDLYSIYKDWNLVIAAYNCGPTNINKAIRRSGGSHDYWKIYNYLPKETRGYVPAFIAANYIMTYYCNHNICPMDAEIGQNTDTIQINKRLHFQQLVGVCGSNISMLRMLNPQYKLDIIPGGAKSYTLRLPINQISYFIDHEDSVYKYHASELFTNRETVEPANLSNNISSTPENVETEQTEEARPARRHYSKRSNRNNRSSSRSSRKKKSKKSSSVNIRKGETLSEIAQKHGMTVKQLKKINHIKGNNIRAGKKLKIHK
jgi:membrane-bound lytic murein transglycosylase D